MKQYRFIRTQGNIIGIWRNYVLEDFLRSCEAFAENKVAFAVEFRDI